MGKLTAGLIILNVIVFLLIFSMPAEMRDQTIGQYAFSRGSALEVWRWVTSLFLHASASHLFFNMLGLYFFGRILEQEVSGKRFLAIYFGTGLLGSLVFLVTSAAPAIGASGAVFGVMGAAMLLSPTGWVRLYIIPLPLAVIAALFIILETLVAYFQPAAFATTATSAHLGGLAGGALAAFRINAKKSARGLALLIAGGLLILALAPVFTLIAGIGGLVYSFLDVVIGAVLYTVAGQLSFVWV